MILEAFARYLQTAGQNVPASDILARWLWERLSIPPETAVDQVLHCEFKLVKVRTMGQHSLILQLDNSGKIPLIYTFKSKSPSGTLLLESLYQFSLSYEQQKWARWVHSVKASDFACR